MSDKGYIKLSRKFFQNEMWKEKRTYNTCEAFLDLIRSARFEKSKKKEIIGGREIIYGRGQYPASIRMLSERWGWSIKRVRSFFERFQNNGAIIVDNTQGMSVLTICNYEEYNDVATPKGTANGTPNTDENQDIKGVQGHSKGHKGTPKGTAKGTVKGTPNTDENQTDTPNEGTAKGTPKGTAKGTNNNKRVIINNIPPTPPQGGGVKPKDLVGDSLNSKARVLFEGYFNDVFSESYYWSVKDAGAMSQLLNKLKFSRKHKGMTTDDDSVLYALKYLLSTITEGWIFENFSVANINSKYNEIVSKANGNKGKPGTILRDNSPDKYDNPEDKKWEDRWEK